MAKQKNNIEKINGALNKKSNLKLYELILFGILICTIYIFSTFLLTKRFITPKSNYSKNNGLSDI